MALGWAPDPELYDYKTIPYNMILTKDIISERSIGIGDELFMTGLFINHFGANKNIPIVRVGNISAMPDEPIKTQKFGEIEAYLRLLHGHWNLENATRDVVLEDSYQDKSNINTGIGIAVPAAKILETLEQSFFVDQRKK